MYAKPRLLAIPLLSFALELLVLFELSVENIYQKRTRRGYSSAEAVSGRWAFKKPSSGKVLASADILTTLHLCEFHITPDMPECPPDAPSFRQKKVKNL
jgi:hypothetical protein